MVVVVEAILCVYMCDVCGVDGNVRGYSEVTAEFVAVCGYGMTTCVVC